MSVFVVCGLHRSGTTFVGKILQQAGVEVVHEPLNERFGMQYVPLAYPYVSSSSSELASLVDDAVYFSRPWNKDTQFTKPKGFKKLAYQLTGGRSGIRWGLLRFRQSVGLLPSHVCLKDPFMSLVTPYLVQQHDLKVVCMVRHPAAIHYSTDKQAWRFDIGNLRKQHELIDEVASDISEEHWNLAEQHAAASIAILWKVMIRINMQVQAKEANLKMVTHEDLCVSPVATARHICSHLGVPFHGKVEAYVVENSQGQRAEAKDGKTHDFKRNSKLLVNAWRGRISEFDEELMQSIVGDDVLHYYGQW